MNHTAFQYNFVRFPKVYPHSPLRYPGGKNRASKLIYSLIPATETKLCSPFLGGASIELVCSTRMKVYGSDIFSPLVDFWQELLENPIRLAKSVCNYYPISKDGFYTLQKNFRLLDSKTERAAAFFALNRSSFSGTTLSGGMSPNHPRFNPSCINKLAMFRTNNLSIEHSDFRDAIDKHFDCFLYLDPPYINGQSIYGTRGDTHKNFCHNELADVLHKRNRWLVSYNDCNEIRSLYKGYTILSAEWMYGMSNYKKSNEVLILSHDLSLYQTINASIFSDLFAL